MKFVRTLKVILLVIFCILNLIASKKHLSKKHKLQHPSQGTRNYRHYHADPSYNPLPNNWQTGPRHGFGVHVGRKYRQYVSQLSHSSNYHDTTRVLAEKARHLH